jgi:transcriptional regulator with XRE-family HTH domain
MELALGERIRIARTRCKKSQVELARDVGISKTTLSDIETGNTVAPSSAIITDIARVLNVSADFLLGLRDEPDRGGKLHVSLPTPRQERQKHIIRPTPATVSFTAGAATLWLTSSFAPEWFADALREARTGQDHHARRREIVWAVCCVESYLFEWARDQVLKRNFAEIERYFPSDDRRGIRQRWKEVVKELQRANHIPNSPEFQGTYWDDFILLVRYRDGLVHARASRPETDSQPKEAKPVPSKTVLDQLSAGWAVRVVVTLMRRLHDAVGTPSPTWLIEP